MFDRDRIVIMNGTWTSRRWKIWRRALSRMEHEYPIYNRTHFAKALQQPVLDLDDAPARFLPWTYRGSLFVPIAMPERQSWRMVSETLFQQMIHQHLVQNHLLPEE